MEEVEGSVLCPFSDVEVANDRDKDDASSSNESAVINDSSAEAAALGAIFGAIRESNSLNDHFMAGRSDEANGGVRRDDKVDETKTLSLVASVSASSSPSGT